MKTNIHFHTQKGIGKKIVRSWVLIGNWGSVPHPLYGARISETDQPTRSILISICSLSSSALPQRYPGYGLRSLLSRVSLLRLSRCCCCSCCGGGEGCCCCLCLSSPFHHRYHNSDVHRRVFSTKARILVLHFRSSSFQIRCLSFHSDDGTTHGRRNYFRVCIHKFSFVCVSVFFPFFPFLSIFLFLDFLE